MKKDIFLIIDGNALIHRAWHALPPLSTKSGEVINAVYGFTMMLLRVIRDMKPTYVAVAFDKKGPTFRHKRFAAYKAQRKKQPDEFYAQFDRARQLLVTFGIPIFEIDGFEADDVIATLVKKCASKDTSTIIATGDLDALQLVSDDTRVLVFRKGISDTQVFDDTQVRERYGGLGPDDLLQYKALRGDPSDNIPGCPGIGEKTAIELISTFHTIDALYVALAEDPNDMRIKKGVREKLIKDEVLVRESLFLSQLVFDVPIECDMSRARLGSYDAREIMRLFSELEFKTLISRLNDLPNWHAETEGQALMTNSSQEKYVIIDTKEKLKDFFTELAKQTAFACDTETTSLSTVDAEMVGMSFSWKACEAWYFPWDILDDTAFTTLKNILEDVAVAKIGHNAKYDIEVLRTAGIRIRGIVFDTMIAAYLINPGVREYSLDALSFSELGHQKISIESLIGKGKDQLSMKDVPLATIGRYACEDADCTYRLYLEFGPALAKDGLARLFSEIEMPLVDTLVEMELNGVAIDTSFLQELATHCVTAITQIEKDIYVLAGEEFNIGSPLQLKKILFEKLNLSTNRIRKGKNGLSTAASELEKMRSLHPIIEKIFHYRELAKLQNTYVSVLPELVNKKTHRLHTSFNQTITATGRLSSSNPNIQNIPIRQSLGREIRKSFIAEEGSVLLAADYSQIELRIVAHLAQDKKMIEAFRNGRDIHTATAAEINGVPLSDVTSDMRRAAKEVNFGILYGMGPQGLAESIGVSYGEAAQFIERYFAAYPSIRAFIDSTIADARKQGYIETMYGRRRYLPDLNASMAHIRSAAERMAVNMPVQGTEADIIKKAMIGVYETILRNFTDLPRNERPIKMLMQVHDELVFEVNEREVERYARQIKEVMESVIVLDAPLVVDMKAGKNWGEMKKIL